VLTWADLAQGANSSIEDGAVLGYILRALKTKDQLPSALRLYQKLRKQRGEAIVRETFAQRADFHMRDGPEQQARDELMLSKLDTIIDCKFPSRCVRHKAKLRLRQSLQNGLHLTRLQCPQVQPFLYGYDAKVESETALQRWPLHN